MPEERDDVMPESKGNSRDKWLMGSVVAVGVVAGCGLWIMGVANAAADAQRRANALETRVAVMETQRDEQRRTLDEMKSEFRGQLSELNRKMDWLLRRVGGGKDGQ